MSDANSADSGIVTVFGFLLQFQRGKRPGMTRVFISFSASEIFLPFVVFC